MKKYLKTNVSAFALALALGTLTASAVLAEEITYTGTQADYDQFHSSTGNTTYVVSKTSVDNNTVTISDPNNLGADYKAPTTVAGSSANVTTISGNTVNVQGTSVINGDVYGAINGQGNGIVDKNKVNITGGTISGLVVGGVSNEGSATNNSVTVSGGTVSKDIYGGTGKTGASSNGVILQGGTIAGRVIGGNSTSGEINNNSVTLESGTYAHDIYGGASNNGAVHHNTVTLKAGSAGATVIGGYSSENGNATVSNNEVISNGTTTTKDIAGGYVDGTGDATGNTVTISGQSVVSGFAYGAYVNQNGGKASGNQATIKGNAKVDEIGGAVTSGGVAEENHLVIESGEVRIATGGFSEKNSALKNTVVMSGGTVTTQVFGGRSKSNVADNPDHISVSENQITISGGGVTQDVVGGVAEYTADATGNTVTISGESTNIGGHVRGGMSNSGNVSGNIVNIQNGTVGGQISGGNSDGGAASDNEVNITGGSVTGSIYGGYSAQIANHNKVVITGGTMGGQVLGGRSDVASATNNIVEIKNATVAKDVVAGFANNANNSNANNAQSNSLTISDNADITGTVISGSTKGGEASNNTLTVNSAVINNYVAAGFSENGAAKANKLVIGGGAHITLDAIGGQTLSGDATDNSVSIENATIDGNVYGGVTSNGSATNNLITLTGGNVKISGTIYGGFIDNSTRASGDVVTGNTLKFVHFRGDIAGIENVQNYNWVLPKDVVNGETLVHITGTNAVDLANTSHVVALENDGNRLNVGDKVTLIDKTVNGEAIANMRVTQGNFLIYDMKAEQKENGYVLTAQNRTGDDNNSGTTTGGGTNGGDTTGGSNNSGTTTGGGTNGGDTTGGSNNSGTTPGGSTSGSDTNGGSAGSNEFAGRLNPQTKAFSEGRAAALGFLNQGSDLIANSGIRAARSSVAEGGKNPWQMNLMPFFVIDGSSNRYKTGSHADVDGFNMAVGLATGFDLADKHPVTLGAFFEYGRGTYDTYNSFATYASVHGDGDTHYTGGGILGRIDFAGTGLGLVNKLEDRQADGLYAEASFRAGHIDSDFDTDDLLGSYGEDSKYDSGADYYGLHGGIGYVMNFDERNSVDVYGRYLWTKIDSETVDVGRDRLHFDEAESSRLRIGTRYTMIYNDQLKPYVGVAYEHEFDGEVAAHAYGLKLDKPSLDGDTGVFEAGVSMKPLSTVKALSVDVNGQGFIGRREGGGGGIKIKYQF